MATETTIEPLVFTRQVAGAEDLVFGFGSIAQIREGESVPITLINAGTIPFDATRSVKDVIDELLLVQTTILAGG